MIVKSEEFDRLISRPPPSVFLYLFHGTDPGLIHERAKLTVKKSIADPTDAFQLVRISGDELASRPGLLADETATIGLFGDSRAIWIEAGQKSFIDSLEYQLENPPVSCKIIIEAGNLKPAAPLRKLADTANGAASVGCYADGPNELKALVESTLKAHNLTISTNTRDHLVNLLGNDRLITRSELEKLCLYALGQGEVTIDHITDIMNDAAATALEEAVDAAFMGERSAIELLCERVFRDGADAAYLLSSALTHAMRLHRMKLDLDNGSQMDTLMSRSGFFYTRKKKVQSYLPKWSAARLQMAGETLQEAVMRSRLQSNLGRSVSTRALWKIASMVPASNRR